MLKETIRHYNFRNCIDATSQCFGCICEILDFWWPNDAPNCLKKEIVRAMGKKEQKEDEVQKDAETQIPESGEKEDITQTSAQAQIDSKELEGHSSNPLCSQTTFVVFLISVMMLFLLLKFK